MKTRIYFTLLLLFVALNVLLAQKSPHEFIDYDCNICHSTQSWKQVSFDHDQADFSLQGQHTNLACNDCHVIEDFRRVRQECAFCHTDVHQGKLGNVCETCHSPQGWTVLDATAVHENTTFPLVGAHARLDCQACHISEIQGEFSFVKSECFACHESEFRSTTNPRHDEQGFPRRCEECHSMVAWRPADFSRHDGLFPIFSGEHAGAWDTCTDCHINAGNYQMFSCLNCHEHNRAEMDDEHDEVSGYVYESTACLSCHPSGGE